MASGMHQRVTRCTGIGHDTHDSFDGASCCPLIRKLNSDRCRLPRHCTGETTGVSRNFFRGRNNLRRQISNGMRTNERAENKKTTSFNALILIIYYIRFKGYLYSFIAIH